MGNPNQCPGLESLKLGYRSFVEMEWPYFLLFLFIICCQWCKISTLHVWMNEHFSLGSLLSCNSNFSFDKNENCNFVNTQ